MSVGATAARLLLLWSALELGGCAVSASVVRPTARLEVGCNVPGARIYVDDVLSGRVAEFRGRPLKVEAGIRRLELRAEGYFSAYREVSLTAGGQQKVEVELKPVPEGEPGE